MSRERPGGRDWIEDWQADGGLVGPASTLRQDVHRAQRRHTFISAAELIVTVGLLALAGLAIARSTQITDAMWAVGGVAFLTFTGAAVALAHRRPELPLDQATISLVTTYERTCRRRLRTARLASALLGLELLALLPFAVWRYGADPASFTSHHGLASAVGTLAFVMVATIWTWRMTRRARTDLDHARMMQEEIELPQ
jgi:hypothetical protein